MELLYLWVNLTENNCIEQQEFNFSPLYVFKVDDLKSPTKISLTNRINNNVFIEENKVVSNITAVVGANGAGKTTLMSFITKNKCWQRNALDEKDLHIYDKQKSIYVFGENNNYTIYYNLSNKLDYENFSPNTVDTNVYKSIDSIWKTLTVYITNSYFSNNKLSYEINIKGKSSVYLSPSSINDISSCFYNKIFGEDYLSNTSENAKSFSWFVKKNRNHLTFQELLDLNYQRYLLENKITDFSQESYKDRILIDFESILDLIKSADYSTELKDKYKEKIGEFHKIYPSEKLKEQYKKNNIIILYLNLIFEVFYYEGADKLSYINIESELYEQIKEIDIFKDKEKKYWKYLEDIQELDEILASCKVKDNNFYEKNDLSLSFEKVILKNNEAFYNYIQKIFSDINSYSYVLRYIRVKELEISSGERALRNFLSWLVLIPKLDEIMNIKRENYESKLLLIDEIDLYLHPEWQRQIIQKLINSINEIEKDKKVQIIITSHSPIILSDFPRENVIYLKKIKGKTVVDYNYHDQSFGSNIYTLLKDIFFLKNGAVGEFAKCKIIKVYEELYSKDCNNKELEHQNLINLIGDEFVRKEMQRLFEKKYNEKLSVNEKSSVLEYNSKNFNELELIKRQLENSLNVINKIFKGE